MKRMKHYDEPIVLQIDHIVAVGYYIAPSLASLEEGEDVLHVENKVHVYLIKWKNLAYLKCTWICEEHILALLGKLIASSLFSLLIQPLLFSYIASSLLITTSLLL